MMNVRHISLSRIDSKAAVRYIIQNHLSFKTQVGGSPPKATVIAGRPAYIHISPYSQGSHIYPIRIDFQVKNGDVTVNLNKTGNGDVLIVYLSVHII